MSRAVLFDWGDTLVRAADWNDEIALAGNRAGVTAIGRAGLPSPEAVGGHFRDRLTELFPAESDDEVDLAAILRGCEVGKCKPHAAIFEAAIEALRARDAWVIVDDNPRGGVPDARAHSPLDVLELVDG